MTSDPSPIESLPPLRELIREASLSAKKSLGQNFLLDLNITRRIAKAGGPLDGAKILEIGPGPGGLTRALLLEGAASVVTLERDERFMPALELVKEHSEGKLNLIFADALKADYAEIAQETGVHRIIANLPYNIATALIVGWLTSDKWPPWYDKIVVMLQKEVAERLVASPASDAYGRLAVLTQARATPKLLFTLPPSVFTPPPKVSSAFIEIVPHKQDLSFPIRHLEAITAAAFGQRRKMLRSSLSELGVDAQALLAAADIEPTWRAEQLSVADFIRLAENLARLR